MSSRDSDETRTMHLQKQQYRKMIGNEAAEIIRKLFETLFQRYQKGLEESMRGSEFVFDGINLLCYKLHKISLYRGGLYIDYPEWLKNKKATINSKNNDDKCFQ